MSHAVSRVLTIVTFVSTVLFAGVAFAASPEWERVDVALHPQQSGAVVLVSGQLPESVKLPAEAELSVPSGAPLLWVGEILGGDPSADPTLTYTKTTVGDSDVYRFTLAKSRVAQIEYQADNAITFTGADYATALKWTAAQDVPEVRLSAQMPPNARVVTPASGAALEPGAAGESYFTKTVKDVKAGDTLDLGFTYALAAAGAAAQSPTAPSSNPIAPLFAVGLFVALAGPGVLAVRRQMKAKAVASADESCDNTVEATLPTPTLALDDAADGDVAGEEETALPQGRGASKRRLVTVGVIGALVLLFAVIALESTKPQALGDSYTRTFSTGEPCVVVNIALAVPAKADPAKTAEALFAALETVPGLKGVTFDSKTANLSTGFCESETSEIAIRQALAATGLLATSTPSQAPVAPSSAPSTTGSGG